MPLPGNKDRLRDEIKNITVHDKRVAVVRKDLPEEERWKAELKDAFSGLCIAYSRAESGNVVITGVGQPSSGNTLTRGYSDSEDVPELGRYVSTCGIVNSSMP